MCGVSRAESTTSKSSRVVLASGPVSCANGSSSAPRADSGSASAMRRPALSSCCSDTGRRCDAAPPASPSPRTPASPATINAARRGLLPGPVGAAVMTGPASNPDKDSQSVVNLGDGHACNRRSAL